MKKIFTIICIFLISFSCNNIRENREEILKKSKTNIYYEIFIRSYSDSNGDGIGDLNGITEKLDILNEMGIEGIWITPIFKSPSYHKYDVIDYYTIDEEYGNLEDLKNLVKKAHNLDIKVILDLPINHTSDLHNWFLDIKKNKDSKYKNYYQIRNKNDETIDFNVATLGGKSWHKLNEDEMYFGVFWSGMPDLNFENEELKEEIHKISKFWIENANIDGYRIDAAPHIFSIGEIPKNNNLRDKNLSWWKEFRERLLQVKNDVYIVGEVWEATDSVSKYYEVFDSAFNFDLATNAIFKAISKESANAINLTVERIHKSYEKISPNFIDALFLSNHDMSRSAEKANTLDKQKLAASILLTLPGNPFIYYGEELGMRGTKPDEIIREPYIWNDKYQTNWQSNEYNKETKNFYSQKNDEDSLLNHYLKWIKIRKEDEVIKYGNYQKYIVDDNKVFSFKMEYKGKENIILHNLSDKERKIKIDNKEITLKPYESKIEKIK